MIYKNITHWKLVEESRDCTVFEGSLRSKMSKLNFDEKILDTLKCKIDSNNFRWFSAVLDEEVRKDVGSIRNYMNIGDDF